MNPYTVLASDLARLLERGRSFPLGRLLPGRKKKPDPDAPVVMVFSPHPDDECIISGLPLRLGREAGMRIVNVAVTQGSNKDRQAERFAELQQACDYLGFELVQTAETGLEEINARTRVEQPDHWRTCVETIAKALALHQPRLILFPHEHDWNSTHIGTHALLLDALQCQEPGFNCHIAETEFWGQMNSPNLMVELNAEHVGDLMAGTSFHVGEVERNPYHLFLPAWMQDNVRRGTELVGGQGGKAPDFSFATLYRLRCWRNGRVEDVLDTGRFLSLRDNPADLLK